MYEYKAYGINIHSEIFLPELTPNHSDKPDLTIRKGNVNLFLGKSIKKGINFRVTENSIYRYWDNIGKFKISNGNEIIIEPSSYLDTPYFRSFILGTVMASLLYQRGLFLLHASAVNINNEVIAFLGNKGYGKSTIAMKFYGAGYPIIADDYIGIESQDNISLVCPGFPSLRLSHESRVDGNFCNLKDQDMCLETDKIHIPTTNNFSSDKIPLKKLYVLKRGKDLKISDFNPQDSLIKLVENTFGISRFKKSDLVHNLNQCALILNHVNISCLEVPNSLEKLGNVIKFIEKDIERLDK